MAPLLRVNGRDLSAYIRVQHEEGFDPVDAERISPVFGGAPALAEGQTFVGSAVANKSMVVPLLLSASDRPSLHQLIRDIGNDLVRGAQVEYAHDPSVDSSTFFWLEEGRLDPEYQYFLSNAGVTRATLHLWVRPFGSTGTMRTIASLSATTGPVQFAATGIVGDAYALTNFEVRVGSAVASAGRVIGFGIHRSASFNGVRVPSTGGIDAGQASSTIVGASGNVGSQYLAIPVSPTGASGISFTSFLTPPDAHVGRHRILAIGRSGLSVPVTMYAADRFGAILGPTAVASQTNAAKMQVIDLGEVQVPARASGQEGVPTQVVNVYAGGASGALINASPGFHLDSLVYLPLDISPGLLRTPGGAQNQGISYSDNFDRLTGGGGAHKLVPDQPNAVPGPGIWTMGLGAYGFNGLGAPDANPGMVTAYGGGGVAAANATAAAHIGSGAQLGDVYAQVDVQLLSATGPTAASGAQVDLWAKTIGGGSGSLPSQYIGARLQLSPSSLQSISVFIASAGAFQSISSAPLQASVASAIMGGFRHTLAVQVQGATVLAFIGTTIGPGQAAPVGFSHAGAPMAGNPGLYMKTPSYAAGGALFFDNFQARQLGGSAIDMNAREWFHFDGYPDVRAFQGNASVFTADRSGNFRGAPLRLPPTGSPIASGPMQIVAFQGEVDNFVGNDIIDLRLDTLERFTYLR